MLELDLSVFVVHVKLLPDSVFVFLLNVWDFFVLHALHQLIERARLQQVVEDLKLLVLDIELHGELSRHPAWVVELSHVLWIFVEVFVEMGFKGCEFLSFL